MGALSLLVSVAGACLVVLVAVAAVVAGWEWLRQREALELLRRDRAIYAATSPLPLAASARPAKVDDVRAVAGEPGGRTLALAVAGAAGGAPLAAQAAHREPTWIETRPMVLSCAPATDDETVLRRREPDLRLD